MPIFDEYANSYKSTLEKSLAKVGESSDFFDSYKIRELAAFLKQNSALLNPTILDFGCGTGTSTAHMRHYLPESRYHGIDVSAESIRVASEKYPDTSFAIFHNNEIPYAEGTFDVVFLACVIHHIPPKERAAVFQEIRRVLKPGGFFFTVEHNPFNPLTRHIVNNCEFDKDAVLISRGALRHSLDKAGLHGIKSKFVIFFPRKVRDFFGSKWEDALGWLPLGGQYWIAARK